MARRAGADATIFAFVAAMLTPVFDTKVRAAAESHANLTAYVDRLFKQYFGRKLI
ncbi:MAG: glutathione S-transferase C-terminal domain-containing protein [Methylovirgula sp.]